MALGVNTGRALASIGDDVLAVGREVRASDLAVRLAQMREERERELLELKAQLGGVRGIGGVGGVTGARGGLVGGALSDEQIASMAGQTVPEFRAGRQFNQTGPQSEIKATADTPGMEYLDPADRTQLEAAGGMRGETTDSMEGRRQAGRAREGIVRSTIAPQHLDEFEKGRTEATARDGAFSGDPARVEQTRIGVRAKEGKDRFKVDGDEMIDESSADGFQGQTEQGKAKAKAADALERQRVAEANKDDRTDPNRPRGGAAGGGMTDAQLTAAIEAQRKVVADLNKDFSKGAKERRPQEVARLNALQAEQDKRMGITVPSPGGPAPAAAAPAASAAPPVNLLKEGVNTRFKNGQVWTLRNGKPVKVS